MSNDFEVRWEGVLPGDPQQVWDALTVHTSAWIWEISYEPWVGGAERGLTSGGGRVTAWVPPRHFQTHAERPDGWHNTLDFQLEPDAYGTRLRYLQTSVFLSDYEAQYDQCVQHTDLYHHTLGEYVRHFAGRDSVHVELEAPGSFAAVCGRLGVPDGAAVGDRLPAGTIDYLTPAFLGLRTDDALIRVLGRDAWGGPVGVSLHLFGDDVDSGEVQRSWSGRLGLATEGVT